MAQFVRLHGIQPGHAGIIACTVDVEVVQLAERIHAAILPYDEVLCELSDPPLSSVELDAERAGYEAAALLERLMDGEAAPEQPMLMSLRASSCDNRRRYWPSPTRT